MSMEHRGKGQKGRTTGIFCLEQVKQDTGSMPLAMKYTQLPSCHCHSLTLDLKEFSDPCPAPLSWLSEDGLLCASLYLFPLGHPSRLTYLVLLLLGRTVVLGSLAFTWSYLNCIGEREPTSDWLDNSISQSAFVAHLTLCCPWQ